MSEAKLGAFPGLEVRVERAGLLAFDGAIDGVDAAEDAAAGGGVTAEGIRARCICVAAVGALGAVAHPEEVAQGQLHQHEDLSPAGRAAGRRSGAPRPRLPGSGGRTPRPAPACCGPAFAD